MELDPGMTAIDIVIRFLDGSYDVDTVAIPSDYPHGEVFAYAIYHVNENWEQGAQVVVILSEDRVANFGPVRKFKPRPAAIIFIQGGTE